MNLVFKRGFGPEADVDLISLIADHRVYVSLAAGNASNMENNRAADIDQYIDERLLLIPRPVEYQK
jgi:hypothetical protein